MNLHDHLPAFLVMIPLLGAFITPVVASFNKMVRNAFFALFMFLILLVGISLCVTTLNGQVLVYVMGGEHLALTLPSGMTYPVRILFEIDAMSSLLILCLSITAFAGALF